MRKLAAEQSLKTALPELETPFYYYDLSLLQDTLSAARGAAGKYGFHLHYAFKANFNDRVLDLIKQAGFGADCVAGNEVRKAVEMGFSPDQIVFAGVRSEERRVGKECRSRGWQGQEK